MQTQPIVSIGSFRETFTQLVPVELVDRVFALCRNSKRGRPPVLGDYEWLMGLTFHGMCPSGKLGSNIRKATSISVTDSAVSQRRTNTAWQVFETLMEEVLGPKADPEKHPESFYQGLRLCGVDGTMFSVSNTPQIKRTLTKSQTRHLKAAFAKIGAVTIFELGVHNPLAAAIGTRGQSEMVLANQIIDQLPPQSLLIADRYYGSAEVIHRFRQWQGDEGSHFLFRVKANLKASIVETYPDGSALVEIGKGESKMRVREIKARVRRPGKAWTDVRLWTSLLNWQRDGAQTLLKLYSGRWEHEIAYKELKVDMRSARLLQSHTEATAAQEIAALIIGYSILAQKRMEVASHAELPVLRISFRKTWETVQGLWQFLEISEGIINRRQTKEIINKAMDQIAELIIPERRERSCPRAIRQPVSSRPRLKRNTYQHGPVQCEVLQPSI